MTEPRRRFTISVPPDVAQTLESQGNRMASAYVTESVRRRKRVEQHKELLLAAGIHVTEQGLAEARARRLGVEAEWPQERFEAERAKIRADMEAELSGDDAAHRADAA
ncbi:hypothetical protein ABZ807_11615 [Micromonospora sp. NPDC047548]|uniref:hypothetical protein n=1 Tax=Micromonospora sp. NPDC047548 TaxID=3155624 RepID=UPI003404BA5A